MMTNQGLRQKLFIFTAGISGTLLCVGWFAATAYQSSSKVTAGIVAVAGFSLAMAAGWLFTSGLSRVLRDYAQRLSAGADAVAAASRKISSSADNLSSSSTEQAAAIEETAASIDEMSSMVQSN